MNQSIKVEKVKCDLCGSNNYQIVGYSQDFEYWTTKKIFNIVRCKRCNFIYLNPRPRFSEIKKIYPSEYTPHKFTKSKQLAIRLRRWRERRKIKNSYFPLLKNLSKANILDFGCGDGGLVEEMIKLAPASWEIIGMDIDQTAVSSARKRNLPVYNLAEFKKLLKRNKYQFNLVIANQVIEHVESPKKMVQNIHRYLTKGGILILETPNFQSWDRMFFSGLWDGYHIPRHWSIFEPTTIKKLLLENGYTIIKIEFLLSPNVWVKSVKNFLFKHLRVPYKIINKYHPFLLALFCLLDFFQIQLFGHSSNMRVIAKKINSQNVTIRQKVKKVARANIAD